MRRRNMKKTRGIFTVLLAIVALLLVSSMTPVQAQEKTIILATTTSTQDSGLLDVLLPVFSRRRRVILSKRSLWVQARLWPWDEKGEADVLLVHSPAAEKKFVSEGFGINRKIIMHNDYIIVGPAEDPAKIKGTKSTPEAFKKIASAAALFMSRGDNSGTHAKEKEVWKAAGINPEGQKWYQQTGLGMGQTLNVANEKKGYTLADRGTYLSLKKNLKLDILMEGDAILLNIYHVIEVNPAKWPKVNAAGAKAFSDFMVAKETQDIIKTYGVEKFGSPLFFPDAGKKEEDLGKYRWN